MSVADPSSEYTMYGSLITGAKRELPDVLDVLIAGGGPAGTAAAMRAAELGLNVLVIDADDLLSTIRDFGPDKPVEPDYGGGDDVPFPPGGSIVELLRFETIKAGPMLLQWKEHYRKHNIAARIGSEFTGLERTADGLWLVKVWSYRAKEEVSYRARNVIIAVGAGSPRRFEIPGDLTGIGFRLDDAEKYVGGAAVVVGGGISAAEAVIAISNAKAQTDDPTAVYWSYHGTKLPRVAESKALATRFYDAYVGNGNIRYLPSSEPAAVFPRKDGPYLLVAVDRRVIEGRPPESVHLEFAKDKAIACIGKEQPIRFLKSLGAQTVRYKNREYVLLNEHGELSLPGVFLAGDPRGDRYFRCTSFEDQSTYQFTAKQSRNIKLAIWDGVLAVETIADRAGIPNAKVALPAAPKAEAKAVTIEAEAQAKAAAGAAPAAPHTAPASVVAPAAAPSSPTPRPTPIELEMLLPDGTVDKEFPLTKDTTTIGRGGTDLSFPDDAYLENVHASVVKRNGRYVLEDAGSSGGTWLRVQGSEGRPLREGEQVWLGAQILMVMRNADRFALAHYNSEGTYQATYDVGSSGLLVGRDCETSLDRNDGTLSRRHAQFRAGARGLNVLDLASVNGTYVRLTVPVTLVDEDEFRVGSKRFRFQTPEGPKVDTAEIIVEVAQPAAAPAPVSSPSAPTAQPSAAALAGDERAVIFDHPKFAASFTVLPGQSVAQAYDAHLKATVPGIKTGENGCAKPRKGDMQWECWVGKCGLCVVQVLENPDNFEPVSGSRELDTLEQRDGLPRDPSQYRLACMARIKGPVKIGLVPEE